MITKIFAICLLVEDLSISRDFYEKKLGLVVNSTDIGFVDYKLGETPLALFEKKHATTMFEEKYMKPSGGTVIALQVDDVSKTCQELIANGLEIFEGPKPTSWGQTVAYLHDPDGNIIEITS
jgi:catechol 2,3-dioxygenase-like lactoylglutathione lyase family enzyme